MAPNVHMTHQKISIDTPLSILGQLFDMSAISKIAIINDIESEIVKSQNTTIDLYTRKDILSLPTPLPTYNLVYYLDTEKIIVSEKTLSQTLAKMSSDILVISSFKEDGILLDSLIQEISSFGFTYWKNASSEKKELVVFKKNRFAIIDNSYFIQGISTDNTSHHIHLKKPGLVRTSLQEEFLKLTKKIKSEVQHTKPTSILRASDGDYFFLRQIAVGSAKPGRRALTTSYKEIDMQIFRNLFWENDFITLNLERHEHQNWKKFIITEGIETTFTKITGLTIKPFENGKLAYALDKIISPFTWFNIIPSLVILIFSLHKDSNYSTKAKEIISNNVIPSEVVYALISTKWIFKNFKNEIGIIAGENKLKLIQELMKSTEYQEHLGTETFTDYISVPEKGAANDVLSLSADIGEKIKNSRAKIFLVGAGSAKIALLPLLKKHSDAVFIDVGCGIDAIAGIVCQDRPYFAEWVNYRLDNYDYSKIDFMDKGNPAWNNASYTTITL